MSRQIRHRGLGRTALALAALAACTPMLAQTAEPTSQGVAEPAGDTKDKAGDEASAQSAPPAPAWEGSVDFGLAGLSGNSSDRALFGQYNGMRVRGTVGLLGFALARSDAASGTSMELVGKNLALETRDLALRLWNPGDWKLRADFYQLIHYDPYTPNTGLVRFGTTAPQVSVLAGGPGTGVDQNLSLKRLGLGLAWSSVINPLLQLDLSAKTENKTGSRLFGIGFSCPSSVAPGCRPGTGSETGSAVLMLPEPVDANHTQIEARLSYAGENLRISAGYYGSFYSNAYGTLSPQIPDSLNNPVGTLLPLSSGLQPILSNPVALPPNNHAHQIDLTGVYAFSPTTNANFKLGYSLAIQDQDFASAGLSGAPPGVTNLGAKVSTTLLQVGLSSRPAPNLSLAANLRYNDVDDMTPLADYNVQGTNLYTNMQLPRTTWRAAAAANYQFSAEYRGTLGIDYENIDRGVFTPTSAVSGVSALRQTTEELGVKAELRRALAENVSGSVSVAGSWRDGSNWLRVNSGYGVTEVPDPNDPVNGFGPEAIFMPTLANRQRDLLKLSIDWQPLETLSLQFSAQAGRDSYTTPSSQGLRNADMNLFNADWDLAISTDWSVNGYVSWGHQSYLQSRPAGYVMAYSNTGTYLGVGVTGKPISKLRIGGGLAYSDDTSEYSQTLEASAPPSSAALLAAAGGLPDIVFRQSTLKFFGIYDLDKRSGLRFDLMYQRSRWTDWAWGYNGVPFSYADGTTLNQLTVQSVVFVGVSYSYTWR